MTKEGIRDVKVVEQSFQSLAVLGEEEVEAEKQSLFSIATESRFLEGHHITAVATQLNEEQKNVESSLVADEGFWSEQGQPPEQQQAKLPRQEEEEQQQPTWVDGWEQDSWNSIEVNQRSSWDQDWPTETASYQENIASTSATSSGWGLFPGETETAPYVDLGYYDQELLILGNLLTIRVAYTAKGVEDWIEKYSDADRFFGIDIEWRPNQFEGDDNKAALFQIAGKHGCLIVQLLYIDSIPDALTQLLADPNAKLAGVGVRADTKKLFHDYGLTCRGVVDLGLHAADVLNRRDLKRAGLATLCELVLGIPFKKNKRLTMSNWAVEGLSLPQITYAASDACLAYYLLVSLNEKLKEHLPTRSPRSSGRSRTFGRSPRSAGRSPRPSATSPSSSATSPCSSGLSPRSTATSPLIPSPRV